MKLQCRKAIAAGLAIALCVSGMAAPKMASAAKVTKVKLNKNKITLYAGAEKAKSSVTLKATVKPAKAAKVTWSTSAKKIATVSKKGVVNAKKAGTATITAKAGGKKAVCKVTVKKVAKEVKKITASPKSMTLEKGETRTISAKVSPAKATIKSVAFSSKNSKIATVTGKGKVKGIKAGSTKITVSALDGSDVKATVSVKVTGSDTPGTTEPSTEPTAEPSAKPTTEPSAKPTAEPSAKPTAEPSVKPTAEPSVKPTTEPSAKPTTDPGTQAPGPGSPVVSPAATPVPTPVPDKYEEVEADTDGGYTLADSGDYKLADATSEVVVGAGTIGKCNSAIAKLNTGVDIASTWDSCAQKIPAPGDEFAWTKSGAEIKMINKDGTVTATVKMAGENELLDGTYTLTKDGDKFSMSGGIFTKATISQSGASYMMTDITWTKNAPSLISLFGNDVTINGSTVSGNGISAVFGGSGIKITGLPKEMKVYSKKK